MGRRGDDIDPVAVGLWVALFTIAIFGLCVELLK